MIDQFFVVDSDTFILNSNTDELSDRVAMTFDSPAEVQSTHLSEIQPVGRYNLTGQSFAAAVHTYPPGWDVYTPLGSGRRMVRVEFLEGDYKRYYGLIIESLGIFDKFKAELDATFGVSSKILPIFDSGINAAAIFIDRGPYTPFKVNPMGKGTTFPAYGIFVSNPREMKMFRKGLRTSSPLSQLLNISIGKIH